MRKPPRHFHFAPLLSLFRRPPFASPETAGQFADASGPARRDERNETPGQENEMPRKSGSAKRAAIDGGRKRRLPGCGVAGFESPSGTDRPGKGQRYEDSSAPGIVNWWSTPPLHPRRGASAPWS